MTMAALFSLTLAVSLVGLVLLLVVKRHEMNSGRVVFGSIRPHIGNFFHRILVVVERVIPSALYRVIARVAYSIRTNVQKVLARIILLFEYYLEHALHMVRRTSHVPQGSNGSSSQFLQEVAAHKQKLVRRSSPKRVILDE